MTKWLTDHDFSGFNIFIHHYILWNMKEDPEVLKYIDQFPEEFQEIIFRIRELVFRIVPEASEALKWRSVAIRYQNRHVCYIAGFKNHVTFGFYNGTMLIDPDKFLEGSGKFMRSIKIYPQEGMDEEQISKWILEGFYV